MYKNETGIEVISINGEDYVKASDVKPVEKGAHVVVIADRGWIYEGLISGEFDASTLGTKPIKLVESSVVRSWSNHKGIGGIVKEANKADYALDAVGTVVLAAGSYIAVVPLEW